MFSSGFLYQCKFTERWHCEPFGISFLYRKSLMTGYLTAISAFKPIVKHHSRSVSRADLRGIRSFSMLGLEHRKKQQKAYPGGGPQYIASRSGLTIDYNFLKQSCYEWWYENSLKTFPGSLRSSGWTSALPSSPWGGTPAYTGPGIVIMAYF